MARSILFILIMVFCTAAQTHSQQAAINQDSLRYSRFETFSQKTKVSRLLHKLIFKPLRPVSDTIPKTALGSQSFIHAEGKIIRNIHILTYDPFGYYIQDTTAYPSGFIAKAGNSLHIKTQQAIVRNLLLFKKNQAFDSLLVNESERLLYTQKYLRDVLIFAISPTEKSDSVDVFIRTYDIWSISPALNLSTSAAKAGLTDFNFAGLGHRLQADVKWRLSDNPNTTYLSYYVPNIGNTYISSKIRYVFSGKSDSIKSIELERTFYTPATKWAGGVLLGQMKTSQTHIAHDSLHTMHSHVYIQDYWVARSWQLLKGNSKSDPVNNLILSGRLLRLRFTEKLPDALEAALFTKQTVYLTGMSFTSRKYIRDSYVFNYGRVEFVPIGQYYGLTFGMDAQQPGYWYFGVKAALGNYFSFGYLSTHLEYGSFVGLASTQQGVFTGRINYFTKLLQIGNWRIRQFVKPTVIIGINRLSTDNLTFNDDMEGFEELVYQATSMVVIKLQTQSYSPWNFIGFHFGPYIFASIGMLANKASGFQNGHVYSVLGLGVLIKNDYLMFSTFQLSLSYYPSVPGKGDHIFKTNAFETSDYGFHHFEIAKPGIVGYR